MKTNFGLTDALLESIKIVLVEKKAQGGFDYETEINDRLKKHGKADPNAGVAGSSADQPDAKFTHNGEEHNLEIKQNKDAMFGQIEVKYHPDRGWHISDKSRAKYPATADHIESSGMLHKLNTKWGAPSGNYDKDLAKGNIYHDVKGSQPIRDHYGKDRKTNYIQIGGGHGMYHTTEDKAKLGTPELSGDTQLRARVKYRGTDAATGQKKYGHLIVMNLKNADRSHHNLDVDPK